MGDRTPGTCILTTLVLITLLGGCGSKGPARFGPDKITLYELQSQIVDFGDEFIQRTSQAADALENELPGARGRQFAHAVKLQSAQAAITNISGPNPFVATLDMVVMVTLVREVLEEEAEPRLGGHSEVLLEAFKKSEADIWQLAARILTQDQLNQLSEAIEDWRFDNPELKYVFSSRLSDFAAERGLAPTTAGGGALPSSIFGFLYLDPLAGLDPTVREIEQSRLLAERAIYTAQRTPSILRWQVEGLFHDLVLTPEATSVLEAVASAAESGRTVSDFATGLPETIAAEREAALAQVEVLIERQREGAMEQISDVVAREREEFLASLDEATVPVNTTLAELRSTIDSGRDLATRLDRFVEKSDALAKTLRLDQPRDREPLDLEQLRGAATELSVTARELTTLVDSVALVTEPAKTQQTTQAIEQTVSSALAQSHRTGLGLINAAAWRAAGLVLLLGLVLAGVRLIPKRGRAQGSA